MKRVVVILSLGVLAAMTAYCAVYFAKTRDQRQLLESPAPELAWLKKEFHLGDAEFSRIATLHDGYLPRCEELCRRIAQKNSELKQLVAGTNVDAQAVERTLKEAADLRADCQKNMFNHFLDVSRQMPPEQGRRYLQWVQQQTLAPDHDMGQRHTSEKVPTAPEAPQHHH
jgi:hypothetical protein